MGVFLAIQGLLKPPAAASLSGNVTWNNLLNATINTPNYRHSTAGYWSHANSDQVISPTAAAYFSFVAPATDPLAMAYLVSSYPYTPNAGISSTDFVLKVTLNAGYITVYRGGAAETYVSSPSYAAGDIASIGFDGSGHLQVKKNGIAFWTDTATTTGNHALLVGAQNDGGTPGLDSITYQL